MVAIDVVPTTTTDAAIGSSSSISSSKPKRRRRKRPLERNEINSLICVASLTALYLFFLFQTSRVLDSLQEGRNAGGNFRFHGFLYDTRQNIPTNNKKINNNNTNYVRTIVQRSNKDQLVDSEEGQRPRQSCREVARASCSVSADEGP